jgi:hypothetical protein
VIHHDLGCHYQRSFGLPPDQGSVANTAPRETFQTFRRAMRTLTCSVKFDPRFIDIDQLWNVNLVDFAMSASVRGL